jgi:hypothetical protein
MKIYILIFKIKNYYAAQYEIDMLTTNIQNRQFNKSKLKSNKNTNLMVNNLNADENTSTHQLNYQKLSM